MKKITGTVDVCMTFQEVADLNVLIERDTAKPMIGLEEDTLAKCPSCGRMVRPDVTLYGELLPDPAYENAVRLIQFADCLIIGGTSLEVGSAAGLAHSYHGKHLIIINKGKTKMEGKADLVFHDSIGKILGEL